MFDDASFTVFFNSSVTFEGYLTILNVKLLQSPAVICYTLYAPICHKITAPEAQFLEVRATLGERSQSCVTDVTLTNVQSSESSAGPGQDGNGIIANCFTAPSVEIPQFIASPGNHFEASVRYLVALCHRQVPECRSKLGQFVQAKVCYLGAIGYTQFSQRRAETRYVFYASICNTKTCRLLADTSTNYSCIYLNVNAKRIDLLYE